MRGPSPTVRCLVGRVKFLPPSRSLPTWGKTRPPASRAPAVFQVPAVTALLPGLWGPSQPFALCAAGLCGPGNEWSGGRDGVGDSLSAWVRHAGGARGTRRVHLGAAASRRLGPGGGGRRRELRAAAAVPWGRAGRPCRRLLGGFFSPLPRLRDDGGGGAPGRGG